MEKRVTRAEWLRAAAYTAILLWINAYFCRDLFTAPVPHMNSMHGFWMTLARLGDGSWLRATWWPYWDCGTPFEWTYQPLVPLATEAWAAARGASYQIAFQSVSALVYILLPVTLFLMAWMLTGRPGHAFAAGLLYSLSSPSQLLVPDGAFTWAGVAGWRRMYVQFGWDETPHLAGLLLLPLAIVFLSRAFRRPRLTWAMAAIFTIAAGSLATSFFPVDMAIAAVCLWFVEPGQTRVRAVFLTAVIGAAAWALAAPFYSPALIADIREAAANSYEGRWTAGSWTALALFILGWSVVWLCAKRWTSAWQLRFFALFAYAMTAIPAIATHLHRFFLPQPGRYKDELGLAVAVFAVFALRASIARLPRSVRVPLVLVFLALAGEQIVSYRIHAKELLFPADVTRTIEYRASQWAERNLPGVRVMMPGSIAQWTNTFTGVQQFAGGSWSTAYDQVAQRGKAAIFNGGDTPAKDAEVSLAWLQAYGVGAVAVSGPKSEEFWKPYAHPDKFEGVLPLLWREDGVAIYRVPQRSASLAHVVPESAIVSRAPRSPREIAPLASYVAALENPALPEAGFHWEGRNRIRVAVPAGSQALSIQVSYHPGWHAKAGEQPRKVFRDGLGLMWLRPGCAGPCEVTLDYDGGWELRLCRYLSFATFLVLIALLLTRLRSTVGRRGTENNAA